MRSILVLAAALAVLTASGCDINTAPSKPATVECHCAAPPAQAAATPPPDMRGSTAYQPPQYDYRPRWNARGHRYAGGDGYRSHGGDAYRWHRSYAERSVFSYDYHSDSHGYYQGDNYSGGNSYTDGGGYADHGTHGDDGFRPVEQGWIDGYGRSHGGGGGGISITGGTGGVERARLHPWHGYDADCPDNDPRQR